MSLSAGQIPIVANVPNGGVGKIQASSNIATLGADANGVDVYTAGPQGGRVFTLLGSTDDTVTSNIFLWILDGSEVRPVGLVNIPLSSGNVLNVKNVDFLDGDKIPGLPVDNTGKRYIALEPNQKLRAGSLAGLSGGTSVWVTAIGADYQV